MSFWFFVWFVLSFLLLGTMAWSTIILVQQKKTWKAFAEKKGLKFTPNKFFEPAEVEGILEGYNISFFTATQQKEDTRKNRQLTVLQVIGNQKFVDGIGAGTSEMIPFLKSLESITPHDIAEERWDKDFELRSRNKKAVDTYLTDERVKVLKSILGMPGADVLILMDDNEGVFRFETSNPLHDLPQVEAMVTKLLSRIEKLKPDEKEEKNLTKLEDKKKTKKAKKKDSEDAEE
ncbi:MAG: hypothetical protein R3D88_06655 [Alphaproteobacteria bacterium]